MRGVERRRGVLLGRQFLEPGDASAVFSTLLRSVLRVATGDVCLVVYDVFACAAWRRLYDSAKHARCCCWFEQWCCDGCFGRGKIVFDCCVADACVRAATVWLIDFGVVT